MNNATVNHALVHDGQSTDDRRVRRRRPAPGAAARAALATAGALALVAISAGPASAHVSMSPEEQPAGSYTVLTVSVPHGCDGSPTTKVRIQIPESIPQVTPTINPGWDVTKTMVQLDTPIAGGHGTELTERVGEVVYTAKTPLADGYRDAFELSLKTPDTAGETVYFPTIQTCEQGEEAWIERPDAGQSDHDLDAPAPKVVLTASTAAGHEPVDSEILVAETATAPTATSSSSSSNGLAFVALMVGVAGVLLGGVALLSRRRL